MVYSRDHADRDELYMYFNALIQNNKQKMYSKSFKITTFLREIRDALDAALFES